MRQRKNPAKMEPGEPDDLDLALQRARRRFDAAHQDLITAIDAELAAGRGTTRIARYAGYTRQWIDKLRDDAARPVAPRRPPERR